MSITAAITAERARRKAARRSTGRFDYLLARIGFKPCPDYHALYVETYAALLVSQELLEHVEKRLRKYETPTGRKPSVPKIQNFPSK